MFTTNLALERFLSGVYPFVMPQNLCLREALRTESTREIFDLLVYDLIMEFHVSNVVKSTTTAGTNVLAFLLGEVHLRRPGWHRYRWYGVH